VYTRIQGGPAHTGLQLIIIRQQSHFSDIGNPPSNHPVVALFDIDHYFLYSADKPLQYKQ